MAIVEVEGVEGLKELLGKEIGPERVARGHPGGHQHLRRPLRRPPVDPRRRRAGQEGEPVRGHDRPRQPDPVADRRLPPGPDRGQRLQARRQLRLEQGPLPGPGAGRAPRSAPAPRSSSSTRSAAAGGRWSPASRSRSRAPRSPAASATASAASCPSRTRTAPSQQPGSRRLPTAGPRLLDRQRPLHAALAVARDRAEVGVARPASGR